MEVAMPIRASDLSRYYGAHCAVYPMELRLQQGEVLGLLGPNGAGKSTTMQMLTGNLAPSTGQIIINGIDLLEQPQQAKQHLGYLPEQPPLYRDMTVREYLQYCAQLRVLLPKEQKRAVEAACARCHLGSVTQRLIMNLSKGYQQRVGIAQAILHRPAVVILDEPTVGLDPIQIREIRQLIRELGDEHAVILSTHILPEVQAVCDRVQMMHQGRMVFNESLATLTATTDQMMTLQLTHAIDETLLSRLPQVIQVTTVANGHYDIQHLPDTNIAPALAQLVTQHGWELVQLSPKQHSLEHIFVNLVHQDQARSEIEKAVVTKETSS